jgi:hypothetical protein
MNRIGDTLIHASGNEALVRALTTARVNFVVIGGLAMAWHITERIADDMDLLIEPTLENGVAISKALDTLNLSTRAASELSKSGVQIQLKTIPFYAELLTPREKDPSYTEIVDEAVNGKLFGIPVRIASVSSLIKLKEIALFAAEANRNKHFKDIQILKGQAV